MNHIYDSATFVVVRQSFLRCCLDAVADADNPWNLDGYKMRFDSKQWYPQDSAEPKPVKAKSFLLMCETRQASKPLPIIRWYRDGNAVRNSRHFYIIVCGESLFFSF